MALRKIVNLPNLLTLLRIAVLPGLAIALEKGWQWTACSIVIFAGATDVLDGYLARKYKIETSVGKLLDPAADKILLAVGCVFLLHRGEDSLNPWLASLLLSREFLISGLRAIASSMGLVIAAAGMGKTKLTFQMIGLGFYCVNRPPWGIPSLLIGDICLWIAVVLSYWSMWDYLKNAYTALKNQLPEDQT